VKQLFPFYHGQPQVATHCSLPASLVVSKSGSNSQWRNKYQDSQVQVPSTHHW